MSDRLLVTGLVVLVARGDGKLRLAPLTLQQSGRVRRFITKLHGGHLHLAQEDLLLLTEADALEAFGKLTGKLPFLERWKRRLRRLGEISGLMPAKQESEQITSNAKRLTPNDGGAQLTVLPRDETILAAASEE